MSVLNLNVNYDVRVDTMARKEVGGEIGPHTKTEAHLSRDIRQYVFQK